MKPVVLSILVGLFASKSTQQGFEVEIVQGYEYSLWLGPLAQGCTGEMHYCYDDLNTPTNKMNQNSATTEQAQAALEFFQGYVGPRLFGNDPSGFIYKCWNGSLTVLAPCPEGTCTINPTGNDYCYYPPNTFDPSLQTYLYQHQIIGGIVPLPPFDPIFNAMFPGMVVEGLSESTS